MRDVFLRLVAVGLGLSNNAAAQRGLRESLLAEARLRLSGWYSNQSLIEEPLIKNGVSLSMLRQDLSCEGSAVPVGFAEFEVVGARPVDIFNVVMNISGQKAWNPKVSSMRHVDDWPEEGISGWDNVFNLIFDKKIEFLVWQVADADFQKEEFWMATSTRHNTLLRSKSPAQANWIESANCLGGYYIRRSPRGSRVVITQHVNTELGFWFPMHSILRMFPAAWQGMVDFIAHLSSQSRHQASLGWNATQLSAPAWMLTRSRPTPSKELAMAPHSAVAAGAARANTTLEPVISFHQEPMPTIGAHRPGNKGKFALAFVACAICICASLCGGLWCCCCCHHKFAARSIPRSSSVESWNSAASFRGSDKSLYESERSAYDSELSDLL